MPAKIRLQRFGKKGYAYYHIVVADSRAPRDGKFIERIGSYNPNTNPATIEINSDKAMDWLRKGAQPTDTTRAILSYKGILFRYHLQRGVTKGAVTQETADAKFESWKSDREARIGTKVSNLANEKREDSKKRYAEEVKVREAKAKAMQEKMAAAEAQATEQPPAPEGESAAEAPAES